VAFAIWSGKWCKTVVNASSSYSLVPRKLQLWQVVYAISVEQNTIEPL
jgi:hypothetical protein